MQIEQRSLFKKIDFTFISVILALNIVGLINVYSATHSDFINNKIFISQIFWITGGWFVYLICTFIDYKFFIRFSYFLYFINIGLLILVQFIGKSFYGAQRWLDFKFFRFQPSETMKITLILILTAILIRKKTEGKNLNLKELIPPLILTAIPFVLTVKQPDLGTAMTLLAIAISMILFVGVQKRIIIASIILASITLPITWSYGLKSYQKQRVLTFLDPSKDPKGAGYNSIQSKIAVGSGGLFGKGFRKGSQSQLEFLPEQHTDFIFSVLSEEHGFMGSISLVGLFALLLTLGIHIAQQARDKTGALLTIGILSTIFWHMCINIGMVSGLLPIVGIPLPLISYGGSNMLTTMFGLGLISSVSFRKFLF